MENPDHIDEVCTGYMMTQAACDFYSTTRWQDPADVGNYFIMTTTAIIDTDQKS